MAYMPDHYLKIIRQKRRVLNQPRRLSQPLEP